MTVIQDALPPLDAIETAPTDLYRPEWAAPQELPTEMDEGAAHLLAALVPMQVQPPLTSPAGARGLPAAAARGDQVSMLVGREADQASVSADVASRMGRARVMSALAPDQRPRAN